MRYNPTSRTNIRKKRLSSQLTKEGRLWTQKDVDRLLDGYLVEEWSFYSPNQSLRTFASQLGRDVNGIETRLWKTALKYRHKGVGCYLPGKRADRRGCLWTGNDLRLIKRCVSEIGVKNHAHAILHVANLLARSENEVKAWMLQHGKATGFSMGFVLSWEQVCLNVRRKLPGMIKVMGG